MEQEIYNNIVAKDFKDNKYNNKDRSKIYYAINLKLLDEVIKEVPNTDFTHHDYMLQYPIHAASLSFDPEIFKIILDNTPTELLNTRDEELQTPLDTLLYHGHLDGVEMLLERQPKLDSQDVWRILTNDYKHSDKTILAVLKQLKLDELHMHNKYPYNCVSKRVQKLIKQLYPDMNIPGEYSLLIGGKK